MQAKIASFIKSHGFTPILNIDGVKVAFFIPTTRNGNPDEPVFEEVSTFTEAREALGY